MFIGLVGFDGQTISPLLVAHYWKSCSQDDRDLALNLDERYQWLSAGLLRMGQICRYQSFFMRQTLRQDLSWNSVEIAFKLIGCMEPQHIGLWLLLSLGEAPYVYNTISETHQPSLGFFFAAAVDCIVDNNSSVYDVDGVWWATDDARSEAIARRHEASLKIERQVLRALDLISKLLHLGLDPLHTS